MSLTINSSGYKQFIESLVIISVGTTMHLNRISIVELRYSKLPMLSPNAASCLFVFSILCILSKLRPFWPKTLRKPQQILVYFVELSLILYASEFLVRQVWLPSLKLLNFVCHFLSQYIIVANQNFLDYSAVRLSHWIRDDGFYLARFLLAAAAFVFMLDATGVIELIQHQIKSQKAIKFLVGGNENNRRLLRSLANSYGPENLEKSKFDPNELPYVSQEDLPNLDVVSGSTRRKRQQPVRKAKRRPPTYPKFNFNDDFNEFSC